MQADRVTRWPRLPQSRAMRILTGALATKRGKVGAVLALFVFFIGFVGPLLASRSSTAVVSYPFAAPGRGGGLFGADVLGRDVLSRILDGGGRLLLLALAATAFGVVLGAVAGVVAAYRGGGVNTAIMRTVDVLLGIPQLVFVLLLVSVLGAKDWLVILGVGLTQAPQVARVIHAAAQEVSERDYVKAVASWGVPPRTVIRRHVLPSLLSPLMVESGLRLSWSIVIIAGLSFLGLGAPPPGADWGVMINENRVGLAANPWGVLGPALLLAILAVGANTFSDALARAGIDDDGIGDPALELITAGQTDADAVGPLARVGG